MSGDPLLKDFGEITPEVTTKLSQLSHEELLVVKWKLGWWRQARQKQLPPDDIKPDWTSWGILSGRGFGKTLTAANWIGLEAASTPKILCSIVAPTYDDVRFTCFEGPTGIKSCIPEALIKHEDKSLPSLTLWNDSFLRGFAGDTPDRLRGPQAHRGWLDEFASFRYPADAISNFRFGLRLGSHPKFMWTTTPRPKQELRELIGKTDYVTTGSTYENEANLPKAFFDEVVQYEGTKIGRQELYGEVIDIEEMGVVARSEWKLWPSTEKLPKFIAVLMSLDTAFTEKTYDTKKQESDPTACSVWGVFFHKGLVNAMLLDCWQEHLGFPDLIDKVKRERLYVYGDDQEPLIKSTYLSSPKVRSSNGRKTDLIVIEEKGSGISLIQALAAEQILTVPYNPGNADKLSRLHVISHLFTHGRVWAVESEKFKGRARTWAEPLVTQVCTYSGRGSIPHDDLLDTTTQVLRIVLDKFTGSVTVPKTKPKVEYRRPRSNPYG